MNTANFRRLLLESTEERITPSRGAEPPSHHDAIVVFHTPTDLIRPDESDRMVRGFEDRPSAAERDFSEPIRLRSAPGFTFVNLMRPFPEPRITTQGEEVATEEKIAAPPAAILREVAPAITPGVRPASAPTGRTLALTPITAEPNAAGTTTSPTPLATTDLRIPTPLADRPIAPTGSEAAWPLLFVGTSVDAAEARPAERETKAEPQTPSTPSEEPEKPTTTFVERAIEAILPTGVPLHGVLPLAEEWVELGANGLLSQLDNLDQDAGGDMPVWEQATWIAGAVLVFGGVTYSVGVNRGRRRLDRVVIGTDSALARWEGQNGRAKIG